MHSWVNSEAGTQVNSAALYTRPSRRQPEPRAEPRRPPRWARGPEGPIAIARPRRERGADRTARARCVCYITSSVFSIPLLSRRGSAYALNRFLVGSFGPISHIHLARRERGEVTGPPKSA